MQHLKQIDEGGLKRCLVAAEPWDGPELLPSTCIAAKSSPSRESSLLAR